MRNDRTGSPSVAFRDSFPRTALSDNRRAYESWLNERNTAAAIFRDRFIECPIAHPTLTIRRETLLTTPYQDCGWPEDYDLMLRLLGAGPCIGTVPRRLLSWRDGASRLSRTHENYALEKFTHCRAYYLSRDFLADRDDYILWGHGRTGRALKKALAQHGRSPRLIVDVHPRRIGQEIAGARVIAPDQLADFRQYPIIASVAGAKPRTEIRDALSRMNFAEGRDFVLAA